MNNIWLILKWQHMLLCQTRRNISKFPRLSDMVTPALSFWSKTCIVSLVILPVLYILTVSIILSSFIRWQSENYFFGRRNMVRFNLLVCINYVHYIIIFHTLLACYHIFKVLKLNVLKLSLILQWIHLKYF